MGNLDVNELEELGGEGGLVGEAGLVEAGGRGRPEGLVRGGHWEGEDEEIRWMAWREYKGKRLRQGTAAEVARIGEQLVGVKAGRLD